MATVHPSRMALVPQDTKDVYSDRKRARSPRRHTRSRSRSRERDSSRRHRSDYDSGRGRRDSGSERTERRDRDQGTPRTTERRDRSKEWHGDNYSRRRVSPEYSDYRKLSPAPPREEPQAQAPWRQQENMYSGRRDHDRPYGGGGSEFMESRRKQRENTTVNVWPPSPKAPARELSPTRGSKSRKKSKRTRSPSLSSEDSSEEERRRKEKKEKKRARKEKEREKERRDRSRRSSRSRRRDHSDEDDREKGRKRSNSRSKSEAKDLRRRSRSKSPTRSPLPFEEEDEWVERPPVAIADALAPATSGPVHGVGESIPGIRHGDDSEDSDDIGPQPLQKINASKRIDERSFGGALLRGEGSAMAAFLQDGTDARIPRRGEIGLTSDEIASYESVGYVMSGSRHRRMNAVRMRKENQVISAEEKRGILKLQREERERREAILREEFGELVSESLKGTEGKAK